MTKLQLSIAAVALAVFQGFTAGVAWGDYDDCVNHCMRSQPRHQSDREFNSSQQECLALCEREREEEDEGRYN